jgi:GTP-binding protein YchF
MSSSLNCGIVGLPNVGKSTLFNILTKTQNAEAANYPFCTIEPNTAKVAIKDHRLEKIANLVGSKEIIFPQISITDIAGLVKGASEGEGLGNQFLSHIRETDAIIHVLRLFDDKDVIHVDQKIDPVSDKEVIEMELMLSDLSSLQNRIPKLEKKAKNDKDVQEELRLINSIIDMLEKSKIPDLSIFNTDEKKIIDRLNLLTTKKVLYLLNVSEEQFIDEKYKNLDIYKNLISNIGSDKNIFVMPIKFESDLIDLNEEERIEFSNEYGIPSDNIDRLIKKTYDLLNLHSFFTVGPKEARSWQIYKGDTSYVAASKIHTDIQKGFIRAEVISYQDFLEFKSESNARLNGKLRSEGKEYIVQDCDIIHFLHSS